MSTGPVEQQPPATPPAGTIPAGGPAQPPPAPARPDGVTEAEWSALGDPGKAALVRERQRANAAEQALAAARAVSTPPKPAPPAAPPTPPKQQPPGEPGGQPDIAALIEAAVAKATAPLLDAQAQRDAEAAAGRIQQAVTAAAGERFYDPTDALAQIDLASVTDGNGQPDAAKITAALDALLQRKPHLGRPTDDRRRAAPSSGVGSGGSSSIPLDDRVKATLARMQSATGVRFAGN